MVSMRNKKNYHQILPLIRSYVQGSSLIAIPPTVAQSVGHLTRKSGVLGSIPGLATYFFSPSAFSRRAVVSYWRKYVHEVLVNHLGGLSLPRKSVVRLTDHPDMTLDVYRGCKTTIQPNTRPCFSAIFTKEHNFCYFLAELFVTHALIPICLDQV